MNKDYLDFDNCLSIAAKAHGDVCAGLAIGTRIAIAGLKAIGIADPKGQDRKKVLVYVEIDRCATDAIMAVTGCQPGRRTMKVLDYGKMAATFLNIETGKAVRITTRQKDGETYPSDPAARIEAFTTLPDGKLLDIRMVSVSVPPQDMPGPPVKVVRCDQCGEEIMDMREMKRVGRTLCRPCAAGSAYYAEHG